MGSNIESKRENSSPAKAPSPSWFERLFPNQELHASSGRHPPPRESLGAPPIYSLSPLVVGAVATILIAVNAEDTMSSIAAGGLLIIAASLGGAALGLLFGVPKFNSDPDPESSSNGFQHNNNLTKVSDWLANMVIGVSLVEATRIANVVSGLSWSLAPAFGDQDTGRAYVLAVLVGYPVYGFFLAYNLAVTRFGQAVTSEKVRLEHALSSIENARFAVTPESEFNAQRAEHEAQTNSESNRVVETAERERLRASLRVLGERYETSRELMPKGWDRTSKLESIVGQMHALATHRAATDLIQELIDLKSAGPTLAGIALMQVHPAQVERFLNRLRALWDRADGFVQYHIAVAVISAARHARVNSRRDFAKKLMPLTNDFLEDLNRRKVGADSDRRDALNEALDELRRI